MRKREEIMHDFAKSTYMMQAEQYLLEVLLDIREQNFKIEARLETLSERSLLPQPPR